MAHILLLELPGGNDFSVLEDAVRMGHEVSFFTSDLGHYQRQGSSSLALAREQIEIADFNYAALEERALRLHQTHPFDAILCLIDIRIIETSRLAARLGLNFLNAHSASLLRDKISVRQVLAEHGLRQPAFALAQNLDDLRCAVSEIGYPVLIKPTDGYGSQNIHVLYDDAQRDLLIAALQQQQPTDYGLGVHANLRLSVEAYLQGHLIGCDVFTSKNQRLLLGINDKLMYPAPSFAIRGSCFPCEKYDCAAIEEYAFKILDAINFDFGACHIEMIVTEDGPCLVEVNPRLVSAQIPHQVGYALNQSLYGELINLHLGYSLEDLQKIHPEWFCAIRWIIANRKGKLASIELSDSSNTHIRRVVVFKHPGDDIQPPMNNGDRLAYVMAVGKNQEQAERLAEEFVSNSRVNFQ
jgi:biotin carboxylase